MILKARVKALNHGAPALAPQVTPKGPPTLAWVPHRGLTLGAKLMCLVLRELQVGVEAYQHPASPALVGESNPTALNPRVAPVAGGLLQQQGPQPVCPRMGDRPGERRSLLDGMILKSRQHPRAGVISPNRLTAGAAVEGAIIQGTGEKQKRARRVPPTQGGMGKQEA